MSKKANPLGQLESLSRNLGQRDPSMGLLLNHNSTDGFFCECLHEKAVLGQMMTRIGVTCTVLDAALRDAFFRDASLASLSELSNTLGKLQSFVKEPRKGPFLIAYNATAAVFWVGGVSVQPMSSVALMKSDENPMKGDFVKKNKEGNGFENIIRNSLASAVQGAQEWVDSAQPDDFPR